MIIKFILHFCFVTVSELVNRQLKNTSLYFFCRALTGGIDANNNKPTMPRQEEDASFDVLSKSSEENAEINSVAKPQEDVSQEVRKTKRRSVC